jgi:uncharacterized protein
MGLPEECGKINEHTCSTHFFFDNVVTNLFALTSLSQLCALANDVLHDSAMANRAEALTEEINAPLRQHAIVSRPGGSVWAYEIDGFGGRVLIDDANAPSLLSLPYLDNSPNDALYERTRSFVWSPQNPRFFRGSAGKGIGGPHVGRDSICLCVRSCMHLPAIRVLRSKARSRC